VFMHNDSRYGNIHNTDQSIIVPIFHEGELICWAGATVHEGENGAVEPGGMPSAAEAPYMEGLKMSPFKVGVNYEVKRDLVKIQLQLRKQGDELIFDFRGSSPEFTNRANNTVLASLKGMINQIFLTFVWPDLPRNQGVFAPVRFVTDPNSALNSSYMVPNAQSMMTFFPAFTASWVAIQKFLYPGERKYTSIVAPWYNMINTFIYG